MPSFDIVSEVDRHELDNAVDQTNREVSNRFDFKGTGARVERAEGSLVIHAPTEFQVRQVRDILEQKMTRRGLDIACLEAGEVVESGQEARQELKVRQGIDRETARSLVKRIIAPAT